VKSIEDLVEDSAYKAIKSVFVNNDSFLRENFNSKYNKIELVRLVERVKQGFPYDRMPSDEEKKRDFFVAAISNAVVEALIQIENLGT
jgi:hypothetical protein